MPVGRLGPTPVAFVLPGEDERFGLLIDYTLLQQIKNFVRHPDLSALPVFGGAGIEHNGSLNKIQLPNAEA
jgi:hypothetical protein